MKFMLFRNPTNPFTILEPQDQEIAESYVIQQCRATDFEAPKLPKGRLYSTAVNRYIPWETVGLTPR